MEERKILERIIKEGGSCDWALKYKPSDPYYICARCPMSKLEKNHKDEYLNCFEALGCLLDDSSEAINEKYIDKAEELLADILIEEMIKDD